MTNKKRGARSLGVLFIALALVAAACGDSDDDADTTPTTAAVTTTAGPAGTTATTAAPGLTGLEAVCAAGAEEGSFNYWATIEPDNFNRIVAPFEDRYPDIDIDFLSLREEDGAQRVLTNIAAGVTEVEPDLFYGSQDGLFPIIDRNLFDSDYDWSQVDINPDMFHETNMVRLFVVGLGLAYNTNLGGPADLPNTWEELIDAKYEGNLVVDPRGNPYDLLSILWGEEFTLDYVQRLKDTVDPIIIRGGTAGMTEVIIGGALMTSSGRADSKSLISASARAASARSSGSSLSTDSSSTRRAPVRTAARRLTL